MSFKVELKCDNCGHHWMETIPDGYLRGIEEAYCYREGKENDKITWTCPSCKTKSRVKWNI